HRNTAPLLCPLTSLTHLAAQVGSRSARPSRCSTPARARPVGHPANRAASRRRTTSPVAALGAPTKPDRRGGNTPSSHARRLPLPRDLSSRPRAKGKGGRGEQ